MQIQTVLGPVPADTWGVTAIHEHVFIDLSAEKGDADARMDDAELITAEVGDFVAAGGAAMVEATSHGMGRNIAGLIGVSRRTGCHIVASTGFYHGRWLPPFVREWDVAELAELMIKELSVGIGETGARAGVVAEIGTSLNCILPEENKVFRAAAVAHRRTGCPIMTHCTMGTMAVEQIGFLDSQGVDLSRVSISHLDLQADTAYHVEIARSGAFLQFDTIGKQRYQSDAIRLKLALELIDRGWERHLMLSCDISRPTYLRRRRGHGYRHLLTDFVPQLRAAGVGESTLWTILVENPRRFLQSWEQVGTA